MTQLRVLPYLRQSRAREGETSDDSLSLDSQESAIAERAEREGWRLLPAIRDHDLKGNDPDRPGIAEMFARASAGEVDAVVVFKINRFARDFLWQEITWRKLRSLGVRLISVTEPNVESTLVRGILGVVAEVQREDMGAAITAALAERAKRGFVNGVAPYGYKKRDVIEVNGSNGERRMRPTGPLVIDEVEAAVIREAVRRVLAGESLNAVTNDLERRGVATRRHATWSIGTMRKILRSPALLGDVTFRGTVVASAGHPALLDQETWDAVQERLKHHLWPRRTVSGLRSWCAGVSEHACGKRMYLVPVKGAPPARRIYTQFLCGSAPTARDCGVPRRRISAPKLEAAARACLEADLSRLLPLQAALARAEVNAGGAPAALGRNALEDRLRVVNHRHDRARERWLAGREPLTWMDEEDARYETELAQIATDRERLPAAPDPMSFRTLSAMLEDCAELVELGSAEALGRVVAQLGTVIVSGEGVRIRYRPGYAEFLPDPVVIVPRNVGLLVRTL